eukprot:GEMP01023780.1.p1 GENE.GEMP01023780.1~~GEMP01023780.1.p1  ORF type:complete len:693 (+),score=187.03 GEMP01023780.1:50-2128(+)
MDVRVQKRIQALLATNDLVAVQDLLAGCAAENPASLFDFLEGLPTQKRKRGIRKILLQAMWQIDPIVLQSILERRLLEWLATPTLSIMMAALHSDPFPNTAAVRTALRKLAADNFSIFAHILAPDEHHGNRKKHDSSNADGQSASLDKELITLDARNHTARATAEKTKTSGPQQGTADMRVTAKPITFTPPMSAEDAFAVLDGLHVSLNALKGASMEWRVAALMCEGNTKVAQDWGLWDHPLLYSVLQLAKEKEDLANAMPVIVPNVTWLCEPLQRPWAFEDVEVAMDVEWRNPRPVSLIQLAIRAGEDVEIVFIDMLEDLSAACIEWTRHLFQRAKLKTLAPGQDTSKKVGLAAITKAYLGIELDKSLQRSNWDKRPLTPHQIAYAARDATVLLELWDKRGDAVWEETSGDTVKEFIANGDNGDPSARCNEDGSVRLALSAMEGKAIRILRGLGIDSEGLHGSVRELRQHRDRSVVLRAPRNQDERRVGIHYLDVGPSDSSDVMVQKIMQDFHIEVKDTDLCARCVKCNCNTWIRVETEDLLDGEVRRHVMEANDFFWRCGKCSKLYWEGGLWEKATIRFRKLASVATNDDHGEDIEEFTQTRIRTQVEYYFGNPNLDRPDEFLRRHMDADGFVPLVSLMGFARMRLFVPSGDAQRVAEALTSSELLELDSTLSRVRRRGDWAEWVIATDE